MEYIFRTIETEDLDFICDQIKHLSTSKIVISELGEPLIVNNGQKWIFCYYENNLCGFIAYFKNKILYSYTIDEFRNKGVFNECYDKLPNNNWTVVASNLSYNIFLKKGFKTIKNYKKCHKLSKRN